jgi:hypothetical protein
MKSSIHGLKGDNGRDEVIGVAVVFVFLAIVGLLIWGLV